MFRRIIFKSFRAYKNESKDKAREAIDEHTTTQGDAHLFALDHVETRTHSLSLSRRFYFIISTTSSADDDDAGRRSPLRFALRRRFQ